MIIALARLVRIEYSVLGAAGVVFGALLGTTAMPGVPVFVSAIAVFFVATGCYTFDDLSDLECDRANERTDRPLLTHALSPRTARITGTVSFILAAIAALLASTPASVLIALGAVVAIAYNKWLQGLFPLKNVFFASVFPVPLFIGWLSGGGNPEPLFIYCAALAFVFGLGFETMIDAADARGDRGSGVITFATRYGTRASARLATALYGVAAMLIVLPFFLPVDVRLQWNLLFLALATVAAVSTGLIGRTLMQDLSATRILALKRRAFLTINAGLLAILLGLLVTVS